MFLPNRQRTYKSSRATQTTQLPQNHILIRQMSIQLILIVLCNKCIHTHTHHITDTYIYIFQWNLLNKTNSKPPKPGRLLPSVAIPLTHMGRVCMCHLPKSRFIMHAGGTRVSCIKHVFLSARDTRRIDCAPYEQHRRRTPKGLASAPRVAVVFRCTAKSSNTTAMCSRRARSLTRIHLSVCRTLA